MYGAQADICEQNARYKFENDVEMYGAQAERKPIKFDWEFENDVEMYGAQAHSDLKRCGI